MLFIKILSSCSDIWPNLYRLKGSNWPFSIFKSFLLKKCDFYSYWLFNNFAYMLDALSSSISWILFIPAIFINLDFSLIGTLYVPLVICNIWITLLSWASYFSFYCLSLLKYSFDKFIIFLLKWYLFNDLIIEGCD